MNEEQLYELIGRMTVREQMVSSDESISWHAHREAEKISDASVFPLLMKIVEDNRQKKQKKIRAAAYFIIGKVLLQTFSREACEFLIRQLETETDRNILSRILHRIKDLKLPADVDISLIIACTKHDKWDVRHSAIYALGASDTAESKEALAYFLNQEDENKYNYEITYANAALGRIGTKEDIPLLEKHMNSRKHDMRDSARFAIQRIIDRERTGKTM
ncbi:HEAT repeat domain-containing protein [Clostridiales bacterium FE2010]|nr:HEAT repeat domain-containing protein [Clostridiales bacterium FE2010]